MKKYKVRLKADTKDEDEENYDMMFRTYIIEENNPAAAALAAGAKFRNTTKTVLDFKVSEVIVNLIRENKNV